VRETSTLLDRAHDWSTVKGTATACETPGVTDAPETSPKSMPVADLSEEM